MIVNCCVKDIVDFYNEYPEYIGKINVSTRSGWKTIQYADKTLEDAQILSIELENKKIEGSLEHQVVSNGEWIHLNKLNISDKILTKDGYENIKSIKLLPFREDLYDLQVEDIHEFYADGIVSHNSTFLDALSFCLYGKPYRKVRIEELINRKNKRKMWTCVSFKADNNEYEIERGRSPNILKIRKNGEEIDELSTKALTQEELDSIIGVDYTMFKQIISLAVNYNKPFLTLNIGEKRSIIESIFNIKVFSDMLKLSKGKIAGLRTQCDIDRKSLSVMEQSLRHLRKQIRELQIAIRDFQKNRDTDLRHLNSNRRKYEQEIEQIDKQIVRLRVKVDKVEVDDTTIYYKELDKINNELGGMTYKLERLSKEKDLIDKNPVCPVCHCDITPTHKAKEDERIKHEQKSVVIKQEKFNRKKQRLLDHIMKIKETNTKVAEMKHDIEKNMQKVDWISNNIVQIDEQIAAVNERNIDFNIERAIEDLNNKSNMYSSLYEQHLEKKHKLHTFETVSTILSDNGIKAFFFRKYLPILNKKINEYLRRFELSIHIEFDTVMNEKIWSRDSLQKEVSYHTFSEGEKKRIDMSMLLAFIDIAKTICNWNTNLLMFDELLDSAVDDDGLEQIIDCLRNIVKGKQHKTVYVVSHRMRESDQFDHTLLLTKKQGFSTIVKETG